ncbi:MAG TPA: LmeA family phospholipid-binding protein, partial [Armatimonadota bacterium]|nr:LmeA family phospholipid-binding protein [Armatimonadota bacterium]
TQDQELVRGRARRVVVRGRKIHVRRQFMIDALNLTLEDLRYEGGEPYLVSVRRSDLQVEFTDQALNDYLRYYHARYDPEVTFEPDQVQVRMLYPFLGNPTLIRATGRFEIMEGRKLFFRAQHADISFLNQPGFGERFVEDRVNPLLDLTRLDFPARLESVQLLKGRLKAYGTAAIEPSSG